MLDKDDEQNRQQRTFNSPFLWLLAATLLARVSGKTNPQTPWLPYKSYTPNYLTSLWYPSGGSNNHINDYPNNIKPATISQKQIIHIHEAPESDEDYEIITIKPNITTNLEKPGKELYFDEINLDMRNIDKGIDNDVAESNVKYRRQKPELESTNLKRNTQRYTNKRVSESNNNNNSNNKRKRYNNSKRGNRKPYITTTYPSYDTDFYDDDDEITTQRMKSRRKPTTKRYRKRTTTPIYDYGDYDYQDNSFESTERVVVRNDKRKRKPTKQFNNARRRPTTTENSYDDYYDNSRENVHSYEDPDYRFPIDKISVIARQAVTTTEPSTTEVATSTERTSSSTSTTPVSTSPTPTPTPKSNATEPTGYGYGPYGGHNNVSITYGPPGQNNYYNYDYTNPSGYGPSNGNENISITYGPPTGQRFDYVAPLLDAWYSQYAAKNAVVRRIQDLIQNNIYHNHDGHYNDNYQ